MDTGRTAIPGGNLNLKKKRYNNITFSLTFSNKAKQITFTFIIS